MANASTWVSIDFSKNIFLLENSESWSTSMCQFLLLDLLKIHGDIGILLIEYIVKTHALKIL